VKAWGLRRRQGLTGQLNMGVKGFDFGS
jgi:hypothetical protein